MHWVTQEFLKGLEGVGDLYVGKTEGHAAGSSEVPWLREAMIQGGRKLRASVRGRKSTKSKRLRLRLSYCRIAAWEGVAAMEGRCIAQKLSRSGSQNKSKGLVSDGAEGWLYFWDLMD